jgi:tetratricopeptide (TPR) repeat protein
VLRLERELAAESEHSESPNAKPRSRFTWLLKSRRPVNEQRTVKQFEHAWAVYPLGLRPDDPITVLDRLIQRFGGNHTAYPTLIERGKLTSYRLAVDPAQLGASIQLVQQTRGADAARALYREYADRFDHHPRILLYHGELELWMGAYEEAARLFREILRRRYDMKWAWIGLGASAMLQGDLREAQTTWKKGLSVACAGPTLYVYRGECFRRQGEVDAARRDLELAVSQKPQRLSAQINLALLDRRDDSLRRIEQKCVEYAPLLMDDLKGTVAERLEQVLEAMRGNRSSTRATYHLWDRVWHVGLAGP